MNGSTKTLTNLNKPELNPKEPSNQLRLPIIMEQSKQLNSSAKANLEPGRRNKFYFPGNNMRPSGRKKTKSRLSISQSDKKEKPEATPVILPPKKKYMSIDLLYFPSEQLADNLILEKQRLEKEALEDPQDAQEDNTSVEEPRYKQANAHISRFLDVNHFPSIGKSEKSPPPATDPPPASNNSSKFIHQSMINKSDEYLKEREKVVGNLKGMALYSKELRYNQRSVRSHKAKVSQSAESRLKSILLESQPKTEFLKWKAKKLTRKTDEEKESLNQFGRSIDLDGDSEEGESRKEEELTFVMKWLPRRELDGTCIFEYREGRAAVAVKNKAYLFGGRSPGSIRFDYMFAYDITSNTLQVLPAGKTTPSPRAHHSMVHINGALYIFGGEFARRGGVGDYFDEVWKFDIQALKFRLIKTGQRIEARIHHAACSYGQNFMLIHGGEDVNDNTLNDLYGLALSNSSVNLR